ncbi:hypothetical protein C1H46_000004 [Malus baccata]|uniref:Uncharacterized protein n=1 Tax=Malus baccata TaxID=106549 RepID=A0A540NT03_MALBA|nr:hypothetical protein C1H46_000004 [Malus baccata]
MLFLFEYRGAHLLIGEQFSDAADFIISFRVDFDISKWARDHLFDRELHLPVPSYADTLDVVALIDDLYQECVLSIFLDIKKLWVFRILNACRLVAQYSDVILVLCEALRVIQGTVGRVGEFFLRVVQVSMPWGRR